MNAGQWASKLRTALGILQGSRAFTGPYQPGLDLTNRCNIRCIHCYYHSPLLDAPNLRSLRCAKEQGVDVPSRENLHSEQKLDADPARMSELVRELLEMGSRRFQFSGNGEVFTLPWALGLMDAAKLGGAHCLANTNGTLIDRSVGSELLRMKFDELRVTVMAGTADMYRRTHPGVRPDMFDQVRINLLNLAELKQSLGVKRPLVCLVCVVVGENHDGLVDFAKFAAEVRADKVLFKPVDDLHDPNLSSLILTPAQTEVARAQVTEAKHFLGARGIRQNVDHFLGGFRHRLDTTALYRAIPCYYGWLSAIFDPDGSVYPCCRCYRVMGNIRESSFRDIWDGEAYRSFREEAGAMNRTGTSVRGCDCDRCVHYEANIKAYCLLHPVKGRSGRLEQFLGDGHEGAA